MKISLIRYTFPGIVIVTICLGFCINVKIVFCVTTVMFDFGVPKGLHFLSLFRILCNNLILLHPQFQYEVFQSPLACNTARKTLAWLCMTSSLAKHLSLLLLACPTADKAIFQIPKVSKQSGFLSDPHLC